MSKRRINKQQSYRIKQIQQNYQETDQVNLQDGLVISRFSKHAEIEDQQGNRIRCSIRPNLDTVIAGDKVIWQRESPAQGVVVSLYPRSTVLARPDKTGLKKPIAANITQMIIVLASKPEISWTLLDSYLIMADLLQMHAVILLNKIDLPCEDAQIILKKAYQPLSYPILMVSSKTLFHMEALKEVLNHQVSVFVGQSGVGKSSLIASLLPYESAINTQAISSVSELGRHTTSNSRYYHLTSGGALIDSPGVREFCLWDISPSEIAQGYPEFRPYIPLCKFRNCTHTNTPHCAVLNALESGLISTKRYENFIKLIAVRPI